MEPPNFNPMFDSELPVPLPEVRSDSPEMTEAWGERIGRAAQQGDLIDLRGELGAGKTCWVRGFARGLGIRDAIRSPTFTICHVHCGDQVLFHLDAYRLEDPAELLIQGWDEMRAQGVVVVEWGERIEELLPSDRLMIRLRHTDAKSAIAESGSRILEFQGEGIRALELISILTRGRSNEQNSQDHGR